MRTNCGLALTDVVTGLQEADLAAASAADADPAVRVEVPAADVADRVDAADSSNS